MKCFDKVMCLLFFAPPVYMLLRFVRWYMKSEHDYSQDVQAEGAE
ncbi:MAG: hypothetical protein SFY67_12635 [Candidatus Melainabacteria bacterium]|nr:hypothetical protein [Candidatus Melainabacteria bacterium]